MADMKLVIGDKNYSSWSLRPWLVLEHLGAKFDEIVIPLYEPDSKTRILGHSPAGQVPILHHGAITVWDSLAICEYLNELYTDRPLWPRDTPARAHARAIVAEMHSGFRAMRTHLSMNVRRRVHRAIPFEAQAEIDRVQAIWRGCRNNHAKDGPYLFGPFSIADAFYAPVVFRFRTYGVAYDGLTAGYMEAMLAHPGMKKWDSDAHAETHAIASLDA